MPNITFEQKCDLKRTFQSNWIRKFVHIRYFEPVHIDNRVDKSCENIIEFFRVKILYNFFNEHIDSVSFFENCDRLGRNGTIKFKECSSINNRQQSEEELIIFNIIKFLIILLIISFLFVIYFFILFH